MSRRESQSTILFSLDFLTCKLRSEVSSWLLCNFVILLVFTYFWRTKHGISFSSVSFLCLFSTSFWCLFFHCWVFYAFFKPHCNVSDGNCCWKHQRDLLYSLINSQSSSHVWTISEAQQFSTFTSQPWGSQSVLTDCGLIEPLKQSFLFDSSWCWQKPVQELWVSFSESFTESFRVLHNSTTSWSIIKLFL